MHLAEETGQTKLHRGKKRNKNPSPHPTFWKTSKILFSAKLRMPIVIDHISDTQNSSDILTTETNVWRSFFWGKNTKKPNNLTKSNLPH